MNIRNVFVFIENCEYEELLSIIAEANARKLELDESAGLKQDW